MNPYRLAKATGMHEQYVYKICRGEQRPSDEVLNKFAAVADLKVTLGELRGWRALDDYTWDELVQAIASESALNGENEKLETFLNAFATMFAKEGHKHNNPRDFLKEFNTRYVRHGNIDKFMQDLEGTHSGG